LAELFTADVRIKPEIRAAADAELPPDHAPVDNGLLPGGTVVGVDLAGQLFNSVPTTSE
jgi:hypothetical protein